jgi:hypothetical protein
MHGEIAPYALVRVAALPYPPVPAATAPFRSAVASVVQLETEVTAIAGELADRLHDSAAGHAVDFHRKVVLPLRRDVHNGRLPRPALLAALADLPQRIPLLATWLAKRDELDRRRAAVAELTEPALAAERAVLAQLCAAEPIRKAAAFVGRDLLHGLERTAAVADRRSRKAEPTVLRYALRAVSKTSPLSWYTWVGWGTWVPGLQSSDVDLTPTARTRVNHGLLARLTSALLADPVRRMAVPHRLAPALHERDGRVFFRQDVIVEEHTRAHVLQEQAVDLPRTGPLRFVIDTVTAASPKGIDPAAVVGALADRLDGRAAQAEKFINRLLDIGLLVPVAPVDPQDPDGAAALAQWLHEHGDRELADRLREIHARTTAFAAVEAGDRPAELAGIDQSWREVGERVAVDLGDMPSVREDVVLPEPVALGADLGRDATATLTRLMPLMMVFDRNLLMRRLVRDQFVARFGLGGSAPVADYTALLRDRFRTDVTESGPEVDALLAARALIADLVPDDGQLPDAAVDAAAELLPRWAAARPVSYSNFVQPLPGGGLVLNQVYTGFGRFPSRFIDLLPTQARTAVTARLSQTFGPSRFVQFRPVGGFNANLHPMLTDREIGEDARWADVVPESLDVCHDPDIDQIRLRHRDSGELIDVLYLGYLVPYVLPDRMAPLHGDLTCGWVDLSALRAEVVRDDVSVTGRLRYRDVVLGRRSWDFDTAALRDHLATDETAAGLRARHGLPPHLFAGVGGQVRTRAEFEARLGSSKPQYVDLGNALHLRCLPRLLSRYEPRVRLTEALPVPDGRVVELVAETHWSQL